MRVAATERGKRPSTLTKSRVIAPQAAVFLAKIFEDKDFADAAIIVIDWKGDMNWHGEGDMPVEFRVPVMLVYVEKFYPELNARLIVDLKLDLEDFFGQDNATSDDLHEVVLSLEKKITEAYENRRLNSGI